jgi:hypothetical protein
VSLAKAGLLALLLAVQPPAPALDADETAYRARVVAFASGMYPNAPAEAKAAYAAFDAGSGAAKAKAPGATPDKLDFESAYENVQLRACAKSAIGSLTAERRFEALANSPQFDALVADAQRLGAKEVAKLEAEAPASLPPKSRKAYVSLGALMTGEPRSHKEMLEKSALASLYMAAATGDRCVPGERFKRILASIRAL